MPVIGTAGHVDHGKSALVQALTGIDPDRLREEKERGLTIDLGFAWLTLPSGIEVGIVDVPGHERFIKNMLAGAGGVDVAMLVIAADEGPRQQTAEHLAILELLEVPAGIVVITKCDLVESDYIDLVEAELADTLAGSRLSAAPIVRVSALTGLGLDHLREALDKAIASLPPKRDVGRPRLPIDRVFTVKGFGAVVTGTLVDGWLEVGQEVEVTPEGVRARVRGLQRHRTKVASLGPGSRAAVNLSGIHDGDLHRGMTIAAPGSVETASSIVFRLKASRILAHALARDSEVTLLSATSETQAKLRLLDADQLGNAKEVWAQAVLVEAIAASPGDHVIVRTPNETVGGGRIVVVNGRRLRRNDSATLERLANKLEGDAASIVAEALRTGPLTPGELARTTGLDEAALTAVVAAADGTDFLERRKHYVSAAWLEDRARLVERAMRDYLEANNLRVSVPREHVRSAVHLDAIAFDLLIEAMVDAGSLDVRGAGLAPAGYEPSLSSAQRTEVEPFLTSLRANPYSPPTESLPAGPLLAYLSEHGEVEDTGSGVVFAAEVFREMTDRVRTYIREQGSISMAETRDLFGTSRKYAQAFLEHLDALHVTRRSGDTRTLL